MTEKTIAITTHLHVGDSVILTGAVRNIRAAHPEFRFRYSGWAVSAWENNPECVIRDEPDPIFVGYGPVEMERNAQFGNCVEGFTHELCRAIGIPMVPIVTRIPCLHLTDAEMRRGSWTRGRILINAGCQKSSQTKYYPYWQDVVDALAGQVEMVQVGSSEDRNVSYALKGVTDYRGKSDDLRSYLAMVANCAGVISPPSSIVNIAAAFGVPGVCVNGAREPDGLTDYPGIVHVHHASCGYDGKSTGCMSLRTLPRFGSRVCDRVDESGSYPCASCMSAIRPSEIVSACRKAFGLKTGKKRH